MAFALLAGGMIPCLGVVDLGMRLITADRSQREFASIVAEHWSDGAKLVVVGAYEDLCGLTYYTHRSTQMLDPNPEDLLFGRRKGDAADLFLTPEAFEREWQSDSQVFVLSQQSSPFPEPSCSPRVLETSCAPITRSDAIARRRPSSLGRCEHRVFFSWLGFGVRLVFFALSGS